MLSLLCCFSKTFSSSIIIANIYHYYARHWVKCFIYMSTFNPHKIQCITYFLYARQRNQDFRRQQVLARGHSSIKQKSWDSPKQSTSTASALNRSLILQILCKRLLFMLMLKLWITAAPAVCDLLPRHHQVVVPCESLCLEGRLG